MTSTLIKWRIYCITEATWSYRWVPEGTTPSLVCFDNPEHTINENSLSQTNDKVSQNEVLIIDEKVKTQGNFRCKGYRMDTLANSTSQITVQFPYYDINILSGSLIITPECIGDEFSAWLEPYITGEITQDISSPTTILNVDQYTLMVACLGYGIQIKRLSDNHIEYLGEIIGIDRVNSRITVQTATTESFVIGDKLLFKIYCFEKLPLQCASRYLIGNNKIKPIYLSKYNKIIAEYKNNNNIDCSFGFELEYFY
jgi:hypothetical protein